MGESNSEGCTSEDHARVPRRPLAGPSRTATTNVPIVGLGCSSFSTFFWTPQEQQAISGSNRNAFTVDSLDRSHPRVQEWIKTIHYAILDAGITLLDTAPWYGHGTSEKVIGWALSELLYDDHSDHNQFSKGSKAVRREDLIINTKVGRYEAEPAKQFDFSRQTTIESARRSCERMQGIDYIDVLQLHDPEFAPSLSPLLLEETIPGLLDCRDKFKYCRAIGITGYPLHVQHQILQASFEKYGQNIWDQALTYCHYNLVDTSLFDQRYFLRPSADAKGDESDASELLSFADYCASFRDSGTHNINLFAAAPLGMGLLTRAGPPGWHPADQSLKDACRNASKVCDDAGVDVSTLALLFAFSNPRIPCTILGMKNVEEVRAVQSVALRFNALKGTSQTSTNEMLDVVSDAKEKQALEMVRDTSAGPFASLWKTGNFEWDGVAEAHKFWSQNLPEVQVKDWQTRPEKHLREKERAK